MEKVREGSEYMARKKKSIVRKAAGLAARELLKKQIIEKEQVRAAAPAGSRRGILPAKSGKPGNSGKTAVYTALYHALGGKASKESLREKGREKAMKKALKEEGRKKPLKKTAAVSAAAVVAHKKWYGRVHRILGVSVRLLALTNVIRKLKK